MTPDLDKDAGKKVYAYDPHIDPALQFDSQGAAIEFLIDRGLAAVDLEVLDLTEAYATHEVHEPGLGGCEG